MSCKLILIPILCMLILSAIPAGTYQNPLSLPEESIGAGIADPGLLRYMGKYYLYSTKVTGEPGIRCWESRDMVNWLFKGYCTQDNDVFAQGHGWSPSPFYYNGKFYLYICSIDQKHRVFEADAPTGPFKCVNRDFLNVNSLDGVMLLDDDGQLYLFYAGWEGVGIQYRKCSSPTKADGLNQNLKQCQFSAEDNGNFWTEGPAPYKHNGIYYLAYCGNDWVRDSYQVRAARGKSIAELSPQKTNPIIAKASGEWVAPGCNWIITGPDLKSLWNVYHVRKGGGRARRMCLDPVHIDSQSGDIVCDGPTFESRPNPAQPTWSERFSGTDFRDNWQVISGQWKVSNGWLSGKPIRSRKTAEILCKVQTGRRFVAEFNLKLSERTYEGFYGVSICGSGDRKLLLTVDVKSKSLQLHANGTPKPIAKAALPKDFALDVWHTIVIENHGSNLTAYFDGMRKIQARIDASGSTFGLITSNCNTDFGWCGFSNL